MAETFAPVSLQNGTGQALNADYFNRLETNIETFDDRIDAQERGVLTPIVVDYAATVGVNATLGALFRIVATGNLILADPTGGVDGQSIRILVQASGADRTVSFPGDSAPAVVIPNGQWWVADLHYHAGSSNWLLTS